MNPEYKAWLSYCRNLIFERFADGKITEVKYERLSNKLDEWSAFAERKAAE